MSFRFKLCFFQSVHGLCKIAYIFLHCVVSDKFCVVLSFLIWQNRRIFASITKLRRLFFLKKKSSAVRLIVSLYRNIGIDLEMMENGMLCFRHCFFSSCYTPAVCVAASALDDGFIRGLAGLQSSRLCFSQRITEGFSCCLATMNKRNIQRNSNCQDVRHHTVPSPDDFRGEAT